MQDLYAPSKRSPNAGVCRAKQRDRWSSPACRNARDSGIVSNEDAGIADMAGDGLEREILKLGIPREQRSFAGAKKDCRVRQSPRELAKRGQTFAVPPLPG